jgi:UDP-N-acetylglucosamine 3-dehydrogenase
LPERLGAGVLRVGVIGTGRMGGFHLHAWKRLDCAEVVALADPDEGARRRALGASGARGYSDWRRLLDDAFGDLDAVSVACPSRMHAEVTIAALEAGLHVLVEKPIATTLPDALRMRGAARQADRKLMVGHVERFNPVVRAMAAALEAGRIGRIFRAQATRVGPLPARIRDAGVAIDLATHDLDLMQYLLDRQVAEVYADGGRFMHDTQEDLLTCLARLGSGGAEVLALIDVNWLTPAPRRELGFVGERGSLRASFVEQLVELTEPGGAEPVRLAVKPVEPLLAELEAFARCVLDGAPEPVSAHDGLRALAAALAIRESASVRRPVTLLDMPAPVPALAAAA